MLGSLCTLITALTCVSAAVVVTQKPPIAALTRGGTVTMDCNLGGITNDAVVWYKMISGRVPEYVLRFRHPWDAPYYGSGFSSPKFTCTHQSETDYRLIIDNVEEGDSAVYYCESWDNAAKAYVFGQGTKLMVTTCSLSPPVLTVFPPPSAELQSNKASLLCLSSQSVPFADVSWLAAGTPVTTGISTSTAVQQPDQTFRISSYLSIQTSDWNLDKVYTCIVSLGSQTSEKTINKSQCSEE